MDDTLLDITAGLPYNRKIRVTNGVNVWPTLEDFEVRCQVRVAANKNSTLKSTLSSYFTSSIEDNDIVIELNMTGSETREILGGYYDVIISDVGPVDARALPLLKGQVRVTPLVTEASDA